MTVDVIPAEQDPPYDIVPNSVEENVQLGLVSLPGSATAVTSERDGAVATRLKDLEREVDRLYSMHNGSHPPTAIKRGKNVKNY